MGSFYSSAQVTFDADGEKDADIERNAIQHVIACQADETATAGTVTITARTRGRTSFETVFEADGTTPLVIDLAAYKSAKIDGFSIDQFKFVLADFDGESLLITVTSGG